MLNLDAGAHRVRRDVGLKIGKAENEIGRKRDDAVDFRAGERGYFPVFAARVARAR